ncbi:VanZ family membrane protein [Campylobacter mucosalis]|uniref:Putative membrane protein, VanZ family n=1 Tax=Campylobacter mucosalis CCUG 21559 TaxID=1032067 RepID=A0A6G5QHP5_9BACT|nr:VanZ family protein [Campylobacter mucosalis]QCD45181.1 putative membrane protein, VanZ family [Campylobacter mucosalis CCUG 21559]QKF63096.1 VanZ family membrane protein [Campylobacter mucosalis]
MAKICFFITLFAVEYLATTSKSMAINEVFWDKTNHFLAFSVLYFLLNFAFKLEILTKISLLLVFGIQIEIVQSFLPSREFSLIDIIADFIGILGGILAVYVVKRVKFNYLVLTSHLYRYKIYKKHNR